MKVKRSIIDSKKGIFESNSPYVKFIDTTFPPEFIISLGKCKSLSFINCFLDGVKIQGDFDSIYFDHSDGAIIFSKFSCKNINIKGNSKFYLKFFDTIVENLESFKLYDKGTFFYINTKHVLTISKQFSIDDASTFILDSSDIVTDFLYFSKEAKFYATNNDRLSYWNIKMPSIVCNNLILDDKCKFIIVPGFKINETTIRLSEDNISGKDMLQLIEISKIQKIFKHLAS